ncbi:hypothetical protein PV08_11995 [Exophiala spinifera]|uniref:Ubiquitin-like domain-containing protein n=1 Tax=Exophiala spinifera TaxID=91928 RepID=A0A0D2BEU4_9EURO|nr:uncharacterized protein PV08_11995 [Exophiala spinifera]KIW09894.1 hypothetical protein PV08_11995 [Exophiala spinifera]
MLIFVKGTDLHFFLGVHCADIWPVEGAVHELEVESSDLVDNIKTRLEGLLSIPATRQVLIYGGKVLNDANTLSDYNILKQSTLDLVVRAPHPASYSSIPVESVFPDRAAAKASIQAWKAKAEQGGFDDDICLVDPQAHYTELSFLEQDVVQKSEYFRRQGSYSTAFDNDTSALTRRQDELHLVPAWMWAFIQEQLSENSGKHWRSSQQELDSLWTSYLILCRVLANFDALSEANFCTSYYSILLEQSDRNVAEIVKIPRDTLDDIKTGIEAAASQICATDINPDRIYMHLLACVEGPCSKLLKILHLPTSDLSESSTAILALCRALSLLADLGLVSYVGSHTTRFDKENLSKEIQVTDVGNGDSDSLHFDCRTRSLACLSGFLDGEQVWVFRCSIGKLKALPLKDDPHPGLYILTHIEEFADVWGPVWSMSAEKGPPGSIRQHNVSKGVICRVDEAATQEGKPVRCHWYGWGKFQMRRAHRLLSLSKPLYLEKDDLLLIGTRSRDNPDCKYTLDQFEADYGHELAVLGGECSVWESELDSRSGSLSFSKIFGVSVSGTQKRRPQTSLKQLILARWKTSLQTANPGVLNQYYGVEVSHCTGNARRVRIKDLLLMSTIQSLLELHFPQWSSLPWGSMFSAALQSDDPEAVFEVWVRFQENRADMAALVCYVLEILDKTGKREDGLAAAFLNNRQEYSITFDDHLNDWSSLLRDTHLMATYAVINDVCIECHTPDHSTATCNGEAACTVLGTRLGFESAVTPELVRVQPHGQLCKILERLDPETLRMSPISGVAMAGVILSIPRVASGVEIRDVTVKAGRLYKIFLRASNTSYGGMRIRRRRVRAGQAGYAHQDAGNRILGASSAPSHLEPPRSVSAFRPADRIELPLSPTARLQVSGATAPTYVHSALIQDGFSSRGISHFDPASGTTLTPDLILPRLLFPTDDDVRTRHGQQSPPLRYGTGTARDHSPFRAPGRMLSDEPSSTGTALRTLQPDFHGSSAVNAYSDISHSPSLMEDIGNYEVDNLEERSRGAGILYDIHNYEIGEDFEAEAGTSNVQQTALRENISSGTNRDRLAGTGTNASSLTPQAVHSGIPNGADGAWVNSARSARKAAVGFKGIIGRIFRKK